MPARLPWATALACLSAGDDPDPVDRRGRRHTLASVLAVSAAAVAAGARSAAAIAEWATDAPWPVLAALGVRWDPLTRRWQAPGEATIRQVLAQVDGDVVGCHRRRVAGRPAAPAAAPARARGGRQDAAGLGPYGHKCTCWPRWTTMTAPCSPNARSTVRRGKCLPSPAAGRPGPRRRRGHRRRAARPTRPRRLPGRPGGDYLLVVKANQPTLHAQFAGLPWRQIPVMDRTRDHGHGRIELRTLKVAAVAGLGFPHAAQAIQVIRRVRAPESRRCCTVTVYALTSLALGSASPAQLAGWLGGTGGSRTGCTGSAT